MNRFFRLVAVLCAIGTLAAASPVFAGVPKMVFGEDFTATWCTYCPRADCALESVQQSFGSQFFFLENHQSSSDPFTTPETTARANRYAVSGYPTVQMDGLIQDVGADVCPVMIGVYTGDINSRINTTAGISPVSITGEFAINGNQATVTAHFSLVDAGSYTAHQATLYVYEDSISWCCGYGGQNEWQRVVRMVRSSPLSLTNVGEVKTVVQTLNITGMNPAQLHPVAIYEEIGGSKTVIQASNFVPLAFEFPTRVHSVPSGNGAAFFAGTVSNIGGVADVAHLSVDAGFGWPTDFQIEGDPNYYTSHDVALAPGETKNITVRVQTDGVKRIGTGSMIASSQNTGNVISEPLRLFNGAHSILLADADNNTNYEVPFTTAFNNLGYLYDIVSGGASGAQMNGYDCVVWQTAYQVSTLAQADMDNLSAYLSNGGTLFLSSMDFLTGVSAPNAFTTNYLGVANWTNNTKALSAVGVGGDPITNGMNMSLTWPSQAADRVDTLVPAAGGTTIFNSENNAPAAVRFQGGNFRTVFSTICQSAFPTSGNAPNNSDTVIGNAVAWLLSGAGSSVPAGGAGSAIRMLQTGPNPAHGLAEMRFVLGPQGAGNVHLFMVDAGGRQVRSLVNGRLTAGAHQASWDCRDDGGHSVPSGMYFARLVSDGGASTAKVVVVR